MGLLDDKQPALGPSSAWPIPGLLDQFGEYLRRSGRNLGMGADAALANAQSHNQAIKAGADAALLQMQGAELTPEQTEAMHNSPVGGFGTDAGGGGGAFAAMFAGINSKTANPALLQQAKNLIARGTDPEAVRQQTGWMRGFDGEWKYEISDHLLDVKVDPKSGKIRIHHPDLRRAYPDLMDKVEVQWFDAPIDKMGRYDPENHVMYLNSRLPPKQWNEVVAHELQHPIQDIEGFSGGASPTNPAILAVSRAERDQMRKQNLAALDEFRDRFEAFKAERMAANPKRYKRLGDKHLMEIFENQPDTADLFRRMEKAAEELQWMDTPSGAKYHAHQTYERAMGEYEAREAQRRQDWTPDERRQMAPYQHYDAIPEHRLLDMRLLQQPDDSPTLSGLLNRTLGPSPEAKGTLASLLGIGLFSKDAE